jgi:hypothetical protein
MCAYSFKFAVRYCLRRSVFRCFHSESRLNLVWSAQFPDFFFREVDLFLFQVYHVDFYFLTFKSRALRGSRGHK